MSDFRLFLFILFINAFGKLFLNRKRVQRCSHRARSTCITLKTKRVLLFSSQWKTVLLIVVFFRAKIQSRREQKKFKGISVLSVASNLLSSFVFSSWLCPFNFSCLFSSLGVIFLLSVVKFYWHCFHESNVETSAWGNHGHGNHKIIVTQSFSEGFVFKMFSNHN